MCYDVKTSKETQLKKALRDGNEKAARKILDDLRKISPEEYYHVSGFTHPKMIIYANENPGVPIIGQWGLVAPWIKDNNQKLKTWNNTLLAKGETMFEKPSFKESASSKRGIVHLDGFYEHHHKSGKTFPYYIYNSNKRPITVGILYNDWTDQSTGEITNTFAIVTTKGNDLMSEIHNNPKITEPRMPLILNETTTEQWLSLSSSEKDISKLICPYTNNLAAHTVRRLKGKNALGNTPEVNLLHHYDELNVQGDLFS